MTVCENSFKRTSLYVAATHAAFLVGLFLFSRLHFDVPLNPETVVWLDGGGGTGGEGVEAADAGALPPPLPPRPGSDAASEELVLPPVNRVPTKTVVRPPVEEKSVSAETPMTPGKSEIQVEAKKPEVKPKEEAKKPEVNKPEVKPKEEVKKPEVKKPEAKPKEEAKKPEVKKPEAKPKAEVKKPEVKPQVVKSGAKTESKSDSKSKESAGKTEVAKATAVKAKEGEGKEIPKASAAGSGGAIAKAVSAGGGVAKATAVGAGGSGGKGGSAGSGGGSGGGQGTGVGKGVGAGREGGRPDAPDLGGYYRHIHDRFYQPWEQPKTLIRTGKALRVLLSLRIARDGEILDRKIVEGSGNEEMDKSVMVAANKVLKIERLPDGVKKDPFEVSIEFKLDQN